MTKPDIIKSVPISHGKPISGDRRKDLKISVFKVTCKGPKSHVFNMRGDLAIQTFSIMMRKMRGVIGCTYKNGRDVKSCQDITKEKSLPKLKPETGDNKVTPPKDLMDAIIFKNTKFADLLIDSPSRRIG